MKRINHLLLLALILLAACRKEPDLSQLSGNFVVQTDRDPAAQFNSFKTFYISDTVAYISSNPKDSILTDNTAKSLVAQIRKNMEARGYVYVGRAFKPDLGINTVAVKDVTVGVVYPGYWWGYPGYWDPWDWGWYYPYYYPWATTYSITTGSVIAEIIDVKNAQANQKLDVTWTMNLNGALGSSASTNLQRALDGIDQAFNQSPYLKAQ
ncbi:DUF4136 domain-containing protein [Chitinophaga arvensicola]|uniref:DUF4136 domain-containing protein n=1 Tax=Chitinophaga arvensicola TaxID=29529 RepID=A0A1I0RRY6_9BACT|nr:DUF4136 domain-containing protein [Chitinophaga arvensicola]SEW43568.1 protein of unknown function [Chitinophaga arvensicola]